MTQSSRWVILCWFGAYLFMNKGELIAKARYAEKLKNPLWQKRRLEILSRDHFKCLLCKDDKHELQIHHLGYTGEPWEAPDEFLKTLCASCHKGITIIERSNLKLPTFPEKSFRFIHLQTDVVEKVAYKLNDTVFIAYLFTGHSEFHLKEDISQYYHLLFYNE